MRIFTVTAIILFAAGVIVTTSCENLFTDAVNTYSADTVYLFGTPSYHTGNLGGREGADALCRIVYESNYAYLGVKNVRAFINVTYDDTIRDMPKNFGVPEDAPIVGPNGSLIDGSWDALLDGGIVQSLASAGVVSDHYWTGDNGLAAGVTDLNQSCAGWTSGDGGSHASIGWYNTSSSSWLMYAANNQCNNSYRILCVAW